MSFRVTFCSCVFNPFGVASFCFCVFNPFGVAIASLGEERASLSAFPTFVRFVLVWVCRFPLPLGA